MKTSDSKHRIKELMNILGISQTELCERSGLGKSALSNYLNGDRVPRQDKIALIADAFGVDPGWLMGYDNPMYSKGLTDPDNGAALEVLNIYKSLNDDGQHEMLMHARYLTTRPEYIKNSEHKKVENAQ